MSDRWKMCVCVYSPQKESGRYKDLEAGKSFGG